VDFIFGGRRFTTMQLYDGFDGGLLYTPEIVRVSFDFQRVIRENFKHSEVLLQMASREFEELVAELWKRFGYEVELTKATRDGGYDVVAVKHGIDVCSRTERQARLTNILQEAFMDKPRPKLVALPKKRG
jgi:hypothetical protein